MDDSLKGMNTSAQKLADVSVPAAWGTWILTHISDINQYLQSIMLCVSIVATVAAGLYHFTRWLHLIRKR